MFPKAELPLPPLAIAYARKAAECCDLKRDEGRDPCLEDGAAGNGFGGSEAISLKILWM